ncbi:MAG: Mu transposase C-terminal domain-containing protein [Candidatus Binataceae bacterium]
MERLARIVPGQTVSRRGHLYIVLDLPDLNRAVVRDVKTGDTDSVPAAELQPASAIEPKASRQDLMMISDSDWREAWRRYQLISPLLDFKKNARNRSAVLKVVREAKRNMATIYRWVSRYEATGLVTALLRPRRTDRGVPRLKPEVNEIVQEVISDFYLSKERPSVTETCDQVMSICRDRKLPQPHPNTIRVRIALVSEKTRISKRLGYKTAQERFSPIRGSFPGAEFPLAVVQIDHTEVDLTFVDDIQRLPIGRAYLTLAIDVYTRMIVGFYISFDPPSATSVGLCVANAVLPKAALLAKLGIGTPWPIWGKMAKIYVDNAREFRGTMVERACKEHGIILEYRPKGRPNYAGHVERAFRTFMRRTHSVSGTTFSNVRERGDYDAEASASMSLSEFEKWFTIFVVEVYHQRAHKGISTVPPIRLYEQAILGSDERPGIGLSLPERDPEKFRLDFTPYVERTIQEYGVVIDNIHYFSDCLRPWIHARDKENAKLKRKFVFARDPRDISSVYFLDPETLTYSRVPYRDLRRPAISLWELNAVLKRLARSQDTAPNEEIIFEGIRKMREIERTAVETTKNARSARRVAQRRRYWAQAGKASSAEAGQPSAFTDDYPGADVTPFAVEELE